MSLSMNLATARSSFAAVLAQGEAVPKGPPEWRVVASFVFSCAVIATGAWLLRRQFRESASLSAADKPAKEYQYLSRRNRRRTQVAGMVLLIGIMLLVGDVLIPWQRAPRTFALYFAITILLAVWTGILGLGDMAATRMYLNSELHDLRRQMENEILEHRASRAGGSDRE